MGSCDLNKGNFGRSVLANVCLGQMRNQAQGWPRPHPSTHQVLLIWLSSYLLKEARVEEKEGKIICVNHAGFSTGFLYLTIFIQICNSIFVCVAFYLYTFVLQNSGHLGKLIHIYDVFSNPHFLYILPSPSLLLRVCDYSVVSLFP